MVRALTVLLFLTLLVVSSVGLAVAELPASAAQFSWPNGTAVSWTLVYDGTANVVSFTIGDVTLYHTPLEKVPAGFYMHARVDDVNSEIQVGDIVLDKVSAGNVAVTTDKGLSTVYVDGGNFAGGFAITGKTTVTFTGSTPDKTQIGSVIELGSSDPTYVQETTWGRMKKMFHD